MIYLKTLILAVALFIFLRSVASIFHLTANKGKIRIIFLRLFPVIEMLLWVSYAFWATHQLFNDLTVYPLLTGSMIIVLVIILGWYLLRDFFSGIILKAENAFEKGQTIITSHATGTIIKLGYRSMEVETNEGENVKIPYSLLSGQKITKPTDKGKGVGYFITLRIPSPLPAEEIQNMIMRRMLEIPWIISGENIEIKIIRTEPDSCSAEIHFHSLSHDLAVKTEENLKKFIKEVY